MNEVVAYLNRAFAYLLDIILWPLKGLPPIWGLLFISALAGIALLYFFGLISNQKGIRSVKEKIHAALLETVLFRHDITLCLKAQGRMLKFGAVYFFYALVPLVILSIPCIYLLGHLNSRYNARPLMPGERVLVGAELKDASIIEQLTFSASPQIEEEAAVRAVSDKQIFFRVKPSAEGRFEIELRGAADEPLVKRPVVVGKAGPDLKPYGYSNWFMNLLYPGAEISGKAAEKLAAFWVDYPAADYSILGIESHWLVIFFIVSLISGIIASRVMSIEI